ncbi:MAG: hypothetical protein EAZ21_09335 [Betaproteobacteria bacterium]|nr:MAG: hypothetical protein EAZ21_09335 [Betaproteobacteria bacterium]
MSDSGVAKQATAAQESYAINSPGQFFRWWKSQLWACLPTAIREAATRGARPLMISLTDDAIWPERSELSKPYKISQTTYLSGSPEKPRDVALVLGEQAGLRRKVEFPLAVEERLDQVLAYELDRLTPLRADELYYDYRLISRNASRNACVVELIAAPKARADEAIANAKAIGANVVRLLLSKGDVDQGIDLLRSAKKADTATPDSKRWITPALAGLCGLLVLALVFYPIYMKRELVIALMPLESSERTAAEAASVIQRQLEKQRTEYNHVLQRKHASPIAVQVLEDIGKRLPDDTWAQTFEIKAIANAPAGQHPREVIVQGETGSGAKLLQFVQESTLIKDPVLKAAMTRVSPTAERFHFAGELVNVDPPPGLALTDAAALLSVPIQVTPNAAPAASGSATVPSASATAPSASAPSAKTIDGLPPSGAAPEKAAVQKPADGMNQPTPASPKNIAASGEISKKPITPNNLPSPSSALPSGPPAGGYGGPPPGASPTIQPAIPASPNGPSVERRP